MHIAGGACSGFCVCATVDLGEHKGASTKSAVCGTVNRYEGAEDSVMGPYISGPGAAMRSNSHCPGTRTTRLRPAPVRSRSATGPASFLPAKQ